MKLFCFPYAGGSSTIYNKWPSLITPEIEIRAIELAGRGRRVREGLYQNFTEALDDVLSIIRNEIQIDVYAIFGHSMGSKIAYELTLKIKALGLPAPRHVFFSGSGAPYSKKETEIEFDKLSDDDFKREVLELGGTPKEFFDSPELLEFFLPLLRSDFKLAKRDSNRKQIIPLTTDITVFLGKDDDLTTQQVVDWKHYTSGNCYINFCNGGHFFINESVQTQFVIKSIQNALKGDAECMAGLVSSKDVPIASS